MRWLCRLALARCDISDGGRHCGCAGHRGDLVRNQLRPFTRCSVVEQEPQLAFDGVGINSISELATSSGLSDRIRVAKLVGGLGHAQLRYAKGKRGEHGP